MTASLQIVEDCIEQILLRGVQVHNQLVWLEHDKVDLKNEVVFMTDFTKSRVSSGCTKPNASRLLTFNVGGTIFTVSTNTLSQLP